MAYKNGTKNGIQKIGTQKNGIQKWHTKMAYKNGMSDEKGMQNLVGEREKEKGRRVEKG
jgi:hypothetical protein